MGVGDILAFSRYFCSQHQPTKACLDRSKTYQLSRFTRGASFLTSEAPRVCSKAIRWLQKRAERAKSKLSRNRAGVEPRQTRKCGIPRSAAALKKKGFEHP